MIKGIFSTMSSWVQLLFLLIFVVFGLALFVMLMSALQYTGKFVDSSIGFMQISQLLSVACAFLLPACLCAYLFYKEGAVFLKINRPVDPTFLFLSVLLIFVVQPLIALLGHYNEMLTLPSSLAGVEKWMREAEDSAKVLTELFLTTTTVSGLLINLLVVAVAAGVTEEFFFRGSIQQILRRICKNKHVAIWITAIIFSAIHVQFFGFFPRLLLGALLGYLFVWSGNLWIPVIVHTVNNAMAVLVFHFFHNTPAYKKAEDLGIGDTWWVSAISLALVIGIVYLLYQEYRKQKVAEYNF